LQPGIPAQWRGGPVGVEKPVRRTGHGHRVQPAALPAVSRHGIGSLTARSPPRRTRDTRALLGGARQPRARRRALDGVAVTPAPESPTPDAGVSAGLADAWKPVVGAPAATQAGTTPQKTAQHHKKRGSAAATALPFPLLT